MSGPTHITKGDVFDDLGYPKSEASAMKIKATIMSSILSEIRRQGYAPRELQKVLDEYQPNVSNLLNGRISRVSIERFLRYADRLGLESSIRLQSLPKRKKTVVYASPRRISGKKELQTAMG